MKFELLIYLFFVCVVKIVLSLFVAVILDNLELEEDVKKIKQVNNLMLYGDYFMTRFYIFLFKS